MNIGQMRVVQDSPTLYRVYSEDEFPPFEEYLIGEAERGDDGFFRFFPFEGAAMACHHLKHLAKFIGELNS